MNATDFQLTATEQVYYSRHTTRDPELKTIPQLICHIIIETTIRHQT